MKDLISEAKALLHELREQAIKSGKNLYHSSVEPISSLKHEPIWFALEKNHAIDGWFKNSLEDGGTAFLYSATLDRAVSHIRDKHIIEIFKKIGEDVNDWVDMIVGNPSTKEVYDHPATKALIAAGHIGLVYSDYDPRDFQKDLDAVIVFDAAAHVKNWKLIQKA